MGKILQERQSININRNMQSTTISTQLDYLVPEGKIATLPQGYMVGQVADNFGELILQKNFNCLIHVDTEKIGQEEKSYQLIPNFYEFDDMDEVLERNRIQIQNDIRRIANQKVIDNEKEEEKNKQSPQAKMSKSDQSKQSQTHKP